MTNTETATALLEAVARIRPTLDDCKSTAEQQRELPQEAYDAMSDANLFAMLAPKAHGGLELHPVEAMRVWEAVARIDSAAAWNLVMNGTVTGFIAWLPADGANELLADGPTTVAGSRSSARIRQARQDCPHFQMSICGRGGQSEACPGELQGQCGGHAGLSPRATD